MLRPSVVAGTMWSIVLMLLGLFGSQGLCQDWEDEDCENDECKLYGDCPFVVQQHKNGISPKQCDYDYDNSYRGVCCPTNNPETLMNKVGSDEPEDFVDSVSELMCKKYDAYSCIGQRIESLVSGGQDALSDEFPHMVQLGEKRWIKKLIYHYSYKCGGSIISDKWVLSSAHCAFKRNSTRQRTNIVRMGRVADNQVVLVVNQIIHPDYDSRYAYNDIALFQLGEAIDFPREKHVRPICLNTLETIPFFPIPEAIGFGKTEHGTYSKKLKKVALVKYKTALCNQSYVNQKELPNGILDESMMCYGDVETGGNKDTCSGDSGSSLSIPSSYRCLNTIIGVTSFGRVECGSGGGPGIYTRVSYYIDWIEKHVWPKEKAEWDQNEL